MIDLFKRQRECLSVMGHSGVPAKSRLVKNWQTFAHFAHLLWLTSVQWPLMNFTVDHIDDLKLATGSLSIAFVNFLTIIKMSTFMRYKWRFVALMTKLETMYKYQEMNDPAAKEILERINGTAMLLVKFHRICACFTGAYYMTSPILKYVWAKIRKTDAVLEYPMPMRFDFDIGYPPAYAFAYFYLSIATVTVVLFSVAMDGIFLSYAANLVAHLKILQNSFMQNTFLKSETTLQYEIRAYIEYHKLILSLYGEMREIYSPIIFGQFLMTSLQVCVIVYQLVMHMNTFTVFLTQLMFLVSILTQLFMYCYGGEMLKTESLMVGTSVQLSNWYNLKPSHRRMLLLVMLRSQREASIKAGFYEASLANFMTIIKAALSYITLIQSME